MQVDCSTDNSCILLPIMICHIQPYQNLARSLRRMRWELELCKRTERRGSSRVTCILHCFDLIQSPQHLCTISPTTYTSEATGCSCKNSQPETDSTAMHRRHLVNTKLVQIMDSEGLGCSQVIRVYGSPASSAMTQGFMLSILVVTYYTNTFVHLV